MQGEGAVGVHQIGAGLDLGVGPRASFAVDQQHGRRVDVLNASGGNEGAVIRPPRRLVGIHRVDHLGPVLVTLIADERHLDCDLHDGLHAGHCTDLEFGANRGWIDDEMVTWDPAHYEQFADQRLRPGLDLVARIDHPDPRSIVDLGCGTGRLTEELAARWPAAAVLGIDRSTEMLPATSARVSYQEADIQTWRPDSPPDLLFANASLQWIDGHERLLPKLMGHLRPGGVLAVQMPLSWDQPSHRILRHVAERYGVSSLPPPTLDPAAYYEVLGSSTTDVWVTTYQHVLEGENPVYAWVSATGMQRFLKRIDSTAHEEYRASCAAELALAYPGRADGTTLFPFTRLFIRSQA